MNNIKDLTIEELQMFAQSSEQVFSFPIDRDIEDFIRDNELDTGELKVPNYVIYHKYRMWHSYAAKFSKIEFFRQFIKRFTQVRYGKTRFYLLNEGSFELTKDVLDEAKNFKKEIVKKRSRKVSRIAKKV